MPDEATPRYVGPSAEAPALAARWEELASSVAGEQPYFDRTFRTRIFRAGEEWLSLTTLDDDFHEMRIALRVGSDGSVLEATGRMNRHPFDTCPRAVSSLAGLVGLNVYLSPRGGRPSDRIPRSEGCLHLADMIGVAFRAFRISKGHDIPHEGEPKRIEFLQVLPHLRDTCISYAVER